MKQRILGWMLIVTSVLAANVASAATEWSTKDYDLYPGDFDGDGKTDLLYVAKDASKVSGIARSDGSGPNLPYQSWPSNYLGIPWHSNLYNVLVADFNGDGKSDIFMQRTTPGNHYLLLADANDGGKIKTAWQEIGDSHLGISWSGEQHKLHAGDFSGDGKADLFMQATSPSGTNYVLLIGSGSLFNVAPSPGWTDASWSSFKWSTKNSNIFVGNFDGDGDADLLIQAKPNIVMIDYEVPIPVPAFAPNAFGAVLSVGGAAPFAPAGVRQWNKNQVAAGVGGPSGLDWSPSSANLVVGDFDSDGRADVLLQARNASRASYLISGSASGAAFSGATTLATNVTWAGSNYRLIAGNFDGAGGAGVYFQAALPSGDNSYSNAVNGGSVSQTAHPSATGPVSTNIVGRTAGAASVAQSGDARYSVPIWTPPGINGMQPGISLQYSSGGGNGWMGMGWSVSASSMISRCPYTYAQDGNQQSQGMFAAASKLCLDGSRLRLESGVYGAEGSTYRTEIESYQQIRIVGVDANGPTSFEVRTPDGRKLEYGNTADSITRLVIDPNGLSQTRLSWSLNRVKDSSGNTMDFQYAQDTARGGFYLSEIRWTGNTDIPTANAYKAVFVNETPDRSDPILQSYYGAGSSGNTYAYVEMRRRLERIDIYAISGSELLRSYRMSYAPAESNLHSRLQSIQECGVGGTACYAPTSFTWLTAGWSSVLSNVALTVPDINVKPIVMDINGDTRDDLVWASGNQPSGVWKYALASSGGAFGAAQPIGKAYDGSSPLVTDWNGDGKEDLSFRNGLTLNILLGATGGFSGEVVTDVPSTSVFADINGDGRHDVVYAQGTTVYSRLRIGAGLDPPVPRSLGASVGLLGSRARNVRQDFDGDGYEDILLAGATQTGPETWQVIAAVAHGAGSALRIAATPYYMGAQLTLEGVGDFDGDKRADHLWSAAGTSGMFGLFSSAITYGVAVNKTGPFCVLDWDGDGKDDLLMRRDSSWFFGRSTGNGFDWATSALLVGTSAMCGDFDGDGFDDIAVANGSTLQVLRHDADNFQFAQVVQEQVQSVTDGFGVTSKFSYGLLSNPAVQPVLASPAGALSPNIAPRSVVTKLTSLDGVGTDTKYDVSYIYEGALHDVTGRGFVGFSKRTISDTRTPDLRIEETYRQDFPFIGALTTRALKRYPSGTLVREETNTWSSLPYNAGTFESRLRPYASGQLTKLFDGGVQYASTAMTVNPTNGIDVTSGLITNRTTTTTELGATGMHAGATYTQQTVLTNIVNDTTNWCLGRASDVSQTSSHAASAAGAAQTRTHHYEWVSAKCRLDWEKDFPADTKWEVKTAYDYDGYGNVKMVTQTPATGQGQAVRTTRTDWTYYSGRFPRSVTNAKNQTTVFDWNTTRAVRTTVTDPNGIAAQMVYGDPFLRLTQAIDPSGAKSDIQYDWCNFACRVFDPNRRMTVTTINRDSGGAETSRAYGYSDLFGREVLSQSQVLSGAYASVRRTFDALGRVWQESTPYLPGDPVGYTTYAYDDLGRLTSVSRPTSETDATLAVATSSFSGLTVTTTDPNLHSSTQRLDPLGRVARSTDHELKSVDYDYDAFGGLVTTKDSLGNETKVFYYPNGLKQELRDRDLGTWKYDYYPLGELKSQTDFKNQVTTYEYDALSRLDKRTEPGLAVTDPVYDTATNGIGQLASVTSPGGYEELYTYDAKGRRSRTTVTADGASYAIDRSYDTAGRLEVLTYPVSTSGVRFAVRYNYSYDQTQSITDLTGGSVGTTLWQANAVNARGQITDEQFSSSLRTLSGYDRIAGWLNTRGVGTGGGAQQQSLSFEYERNGNLRQRRELNLGLTEDFVYDNLDRLDTVKLNSTLKMDVDYNELGNISSKSDVGAYTYPAQGATSTRPHAVATAGGVAYGYDANGNMNLRAGSSITLSAFDLPTQINQAGGVSSTFSYGADHQRYKQVATYSGGAVETIVSIGGLLDKVTRAGATEYRHTVMGPEGAVMIRTRSSSGTPQEDYFLSKDHLGSISLVTNASAATKIQLSYDAFGNRRNGATWSGAPSATDMNLIGSITRRGYTGHEHLDNLGLIHMNGRVQDPKLGRFLSADPLVQSPYDQQSLNRYSYVMNNPLKFTDPSGLYWACVGVDDQPEYCKWYRDDETPRPDGLPPLAELHGGGGGGGDGGRRSLDPCSMISGGDGGSAARGGCYFLHDPNTSLETKRNVAVGGLIMMTAGAGLTLLPPDIVAVLTVSAPLANLALEANDLPGVVPAKASLGPLKNFGGDVEAAAAKARTQPYRPDTVSKHVRGRMESRGVSYDSVQEAVKNGTRRFDPVTGKAQYYLPASASSTGRGVWVLRNDITGNIITVIDKGS